jgi:2-polyprenyl-3-methyl-5-hydroxy-6-metoxy-1,4-benzoquinol methylase
MHEAARLVAISGAKSVVDLGAGDGGLLSLLTVPAWGYDFQPSNAAGWKERGVRGELRDVFNERPEDIEWAELAVMTEVLEHLDDPHGAVKWVGEHVKFIVASSPNDEAPLPREKDHDCHIWGFDLDGYAKLFTDAGFVIVEHVVIDWSQVLLARKENADAS